MCRPVTGKDVFLNYTAFHSYRFALVNICTVQTHKRKAAYPIAYQLFSANQIKLSG